MNVAFPYGLVNLSASRSPVLSCSACCNGVLFFDFGCRRSRR